MKRLIAMKDGDIIDVVATQRWRNGLVMNECVIVASEKSKTVIGGALRLFDHEIQRNAKGYVQL